MKYHLSDDGVARKCVASVKPCTLSHYGTKEEADAAYELSMSENTFTSLTSKDRPDLKSADTSLVYSRFNIENNILHNSNRAITDGELFYYSSPQGRLELDRRILQHGPSDTKSKFDLIKERISASDFTPPELELAENNKKFIESVEKGFGRMQKDFGEVNETFFERDKLVDSNVMNALADSSHRWMSSLTTEQQEAVSFSTSNGFVLVQYANGFIEEKDTYGIFRKLLDEDSVYKNSDDYETIERKIEEARLKVAKDYEASYISAFKNAPKFDEPVMLYRGTSVEELRDILAYDDSKDTVDMAMELLTKQHNGKLASENSRLSRIPESASVSAQVTQKFTDYNENFSVALEIKQSSATTPVNVSAWGAKEYEVLTNPTSKYRIRGARLLESAHKEKALIVELEEVFED